MCGLMVDWGLILSDVRLSVQVKTYDKIFFQSRKRMYNGC